MRRDRLMRELVRERILVTLADGQAFRGLLDQCDHNTLTLVDSEYLKADRDPTKVDGCVYLARDRVAYIQRP